MASSQSQKAKRQKIMLGIAGLALGSVLVYQFFLASPAPRRRSAASNSNSAATSASTTATTTRPATSAQQPKPESDPQDPDAAFQAELANITPLETVNVSIGSAAVGSRGNIFAFYVPPPPPLKKPDPPPPITLSFLQPQSVVAGTPRKFTLTITGKEIPADAQIFFRGSPKPTKRVSDTALSTEVAPEEYSQAGNITIDVKSQSDPKLFSNPISFVIQASPEPPFKYVGRLGEQGLFEITASKQLERAKVSETIQGVWRVDSLNDLQVEVTHTQYDIKKRIALQDKGRQ
jgi:hypothetical protein